MKKTLEKIDLFLETSLLKLLSFRENFDKYFKLVNTKRLLPNTSLLLKDYEKYYTKFSKAEEIDFNEFYSNFAHHWHKEDLEEQDIEYYRDYVFPAILSCKEEAINTTLQNLIKKDCEERVKQAIQEGQDLTYVKELVEQFETRLSSMEGSLDPEAHTVASEDFEVLDKSNGIPWFLPSLQRSLLSLTTGQFVIVSADFGTGKTAFVISQAVYAFRFLTKKQLLQPILYFNSEGTAADVLARFLSSLYKDKILGGFEEIVSRRKEIKEKFVKHFNADLFKVFQMSDISNFNLLQQKIKKYKPSLVIIDICDKLAKEEDVQSLKKLYDNLRVLSSSECPIIGTSQSGNTLYYNNEEGKTEARKWLGGDSLYGSKAGKGGSADCIITIGREEGSDLRFISTPKKKRGSQVNITCKIEEIYSNYVELTY